VNSFLELAENRQSDRTYQDCPVEKAKIDRILAAARLAPSACNGQPWKVIVVDDPALKDQMADAISNKALNMNHFSKQAPVHLVIVEELTNFTSRIGGWIKGKHFPHIDLGILASHITLAAADEGLGSCIVGWLNEDEIRRILHIPARKRVVLLITIGYPASEHRKKVRKELSEIVSYNGYAREK
jgi:nitroreductase